SCHRPRTGGTNVPPAIESALFDDQRSALRRRRSASAIASTRETPPIAPINGRSVAVFGSFVVGSAVGSGVGGGGGGGGGAAAGFDAGGGAGVVRFAFTSRSVSTTGGPSVMMTAVRRSPTWMSEKSIGLPSRMIFALRF